MTYAFPSQTQTPSSFNDVKICACYLYHQFTSFCVNTLMAMASNETALVENARSTMY